MKPFFYRWWLTVLLAPFILFGVIDLISYVLFLNGVGGYLPLTIIIATNVPLWVIIAVTVGLAILLIVHFIQAYHEFNQERGRVKRRSAKSSTNKIKRKG